MKINKIVAKASFYSYVLMSYSSDIARQHKFRNLLENLRQFLARVSPALGSNMPDKSEHNMPEFTLVIS